MPVNRLKIFIGSVQKEFEQLRQDVKSFLLGDIILGRFISEVFLFEDLPAIDLRADHVYLDKVEHCDIYLGIFGYEYGYEDSDGISPTEREYDHATGHHKTRLIYIWGADENKRSPKMKNLIRKASRDVIRRRVEDYNALTSEMYASLVHILDQRGALNIPPFDTSVCDHATQKNISRNRIDWFLETAKRERGFPLKENTSTKALLTHLNLLEKDHLTNAAVLLFASNPQLFHRTAETKCVSCHGTEYQRPFASQQVYSGDLFEQVDQARDFVLSKINRTVGVRVSSAAAQATYELPPEAIGEAIVNAVAHRDYHSNASVEIRLFSDRLEIWNPGTLPGTLTPETLREDHPSVPNNPLLAESLYLARYIEKAGSGTQTIIALCRKYGLPEPEFEQRKGFFVVTLWRDWLTDDVLSSFTLNDRQRQAVMTVKSGGRLINTEYQDTYGVSKPTATRDLNDLVRMGILEKMGVTGKGTHYVLRRKGLTKGSKGSTDALIAKGSQRTQRDHEKKHPAKRGGKYEQKD